MNTYVIKFLDKTIPDRSVVAEEFSPPEEEWGLTLFWISEERTEKVVYAVAASQVFSITVSSNP